MTSHDEAMTELAHRLSAYDAAVAECVAHIRREFDRRRDLFLSDPGGALDYVAVVDDPATNFSDEVADEAIRIIRREWTAGWYEECAACRHSHDSDTWAVECGGCKGCEDIRTRHALDVTAEDLLAAVKDATDLPAYVEMTGGNTATIYVGELGEDDRYALAIGPGTYHWAEPHKSRFTLGPDLWVGPDNSGEAEWDESLVRDPSTLGEVTDAVRMILRATGKAIR